MLKAITALTTTVFSSQISGVSGISAAAMHDGGLSNAAPRMGGGELGAAPGGFMPPPRGGLTGGAGRNIVRRKKDRVRKKSRMDTANANLEGLREELARLMGDWILDGGEDNEIQQAEDGQDGFMQARKHGEEKDYGGNVDIKRDVAGMNEDALNQMVPKLDKHHMIDPKYNMVYGMTPFLKKIYYKDFRKVASSIMTLQKYKNRVGTDGGDDNASERASSEISDDGEGGNTLSPEKAAELFLQEETEDYRAYVKKAKREGKTPIPFGEEPFERDYWNITSSLTFMFEMVKELNEKEERLSLEVLEHKSNGKWKKTKVAAKKLILELIKEVKAVREHPNPLIPLEKEDFEEFDEALIENAPEDNEFDANTYLDAEFHSIRQHYEGDVGNHCVPTGGDDDDSEDEMDQARDKAEAQAAAEAAVQAAIAERLRKKQEEEAQKLAAKEGEETKPEEFAPPAAAFGDSSGQGTRLKQLKEKRRQKALKEKQDTEAAMAEAEAKLNKERDEVLQHQTELQELKIREIARAAKKEAKRKAKLEAAKKFDLKSLNALAFFLPEKFEDAEIAAAQTARDGDASDCSSVVTSDSEAEFEEGKYRTMWWHTKRPDKRDRGDLEYFCPDGWVRFAINKKIQNKLKKEATANGGAPNNDFEGYQILYVGTDPVSVFTMLTNAYKGAGGKDGESDQAIMDKVVKKSLLANKNNIFNKDGTVLMSPSIDYMSHPQSSSVFYNPMTKQYVQLVFQVRLKPPSTLEAETGKPVKMSASTVFGPKLAEMNVHLGGPGRLTEPVFETDEQGNQVTREVPIGDGKTIQVPVVKQPATYVTTAWEKLEYHVPQELLEDPHNFFVTGLMVRTTDKHPASADPRYNNIWYSRPEVKNEILDTLIDTEEVDRSVLDTDLNSWPPSKGETAKYWEKIEDGNMEFTPFSASSALLTEDEDSDSDSDSDSNSDGEKSEDSNASEKARKTNWNNMRTQDLADRPHEKNFKVYADRDPEALRKFTEIYITKRPFDQGGMRQAYLIKARCEKTGRTGLYVAKKYNEVTRDKILDPNNKTWGKVAGNKEKLRAAMRADVSNYFTAAYYLRDLHMRDLNKPIFRKLKQLKSVFKPKFVKPYEWDRSADPNRHTYFMIEKYISGHFVKWCNNIGWTNEEECMEKPRREMGHPNSSDYIPPHVRKDASSLVHTLTHWSRHASGRKTLDMQVVHNLMVVDLQGWIRPYAMNAPGAEVSDKDFLDEDTDLIDPEPEDDEEVIPQYRIILTDPIVHTWLLNQEPQTNHTFGLGDGHNTGFKLCYNPHKPYCPLCNPDMSKGVTTGGQTVCPVAAPARPANIASPAPAPVPVTPVPETTTTEPVNVVAPVVPDAPAPVVPQQPDSDSEEEDSTAVVAQPPVTQPPPIAVVSDSDDDSSEEDSDDDQSS